MASSTSVNDQITDAVTQANVKVVGEAPAMAMGSIYQALAHSTGILFENAANAQQQANIASQAATNQGVMQIYSVDTANEAVSHANLPDNMLSLQTVLRGVVVPDKK